MANIIICSEAGIFSAFSMIHFTCQIVWPQVTGSVLSPVSQSHLFANVLIVICMRQQSGKGERERWRAKDEGLEEILFIYQCTYKVIIRSWFMAHGNPWYGGLGFAHGLDRINLNGSWLSRLAKLRYCSLPPDLILIRTFK